MTHRDKNIQLFLTEVDSGSSRHCSLFVAALRSITFYFFYVLHAVYFTYAIYNNDNRVGRNLEPPSSVISAGVGPTNDSRH